MTNNDILRRLRFVFDFNDSTMIAIFALADSIVTREQISDWLKQEDKPGYKEINDTQMAIFLNGLIVKNRGKKEGAAFAPETVLNNNIIFRKLRIALELNDIAVIEILKSAGFPIGKQELSALFRKSDHKNYRPCQDQLLRNFLKGLQILHNRPS